MKSWSCVSFAAAVFMGLISCTSNNMQSEIPADPPISDFAFVSTRNANRVVQVVSRDGQLQKVISDGNRDSTNPVWSPDGTKLAFESSFNGSDFQLYVINADGSEQRQLVDLPAGAHLPAWSPDGRMIAFLSGKSEAQDIYLVHINSANLTMLASDLPVKFAPVFSRDGSQLYVVAIAAPHWSLYRIALENGEISRMWQRPLNGFINPSWSHDRQKIAFVTVGENGASLRVIDVDGSNERLLSHAPFSDATASWSPFDQKLIFSSGSDIWIVQLDGSGETNLTLNNSGNYAPMWSPDGKRVAFVSIRDGNSEIYLMNANGSTLQRVTRDANEDIQPRWSPVIIE